MSNIIPTNTLRTIYASPPTQATQDTQSTKAHPTTSLHSLSRPRSSHSLSPTNDPHAPRDITKTDFVLGRSAIFTIIIVCIILIVLIVVAVVKAGQIAKRNARNKKAKQEADQAMGVVSRAIREYAGVGGLVVPLLALVGQAVLW